MTRRSGLAGIAWRLVLVLALVGVGGAAAAADEPPPPGKIAFARASGIWTWSNGEQASVIDGPNLSDPRWSPDGTELLYVRSGNSFSDVVIRNLRLNADVPLTNYRSSAEEGTPEYVTGSSWALDPSWSASGLIGFIADVNSTDGALTLWLARDPLSSPYQPPLTSVEDNIESLSLSADGGFAAYVVQKRLPDGTSAVSVRLRDLQDGTAATLADQGGGVFDPAIAPDGQHIAVTIRGGTGGSDVWVVGRANGALVRVTTDFQASASCWSPDGAWLSFIRMIDFKFEVWAVPMANGAPSGSARHLFDAPDINATSGLSWTLRG